MSYGLVLVAILVLIFWWGTRFDYYTNRDVRTRPEIPIRDVQLKPGDLIFGHWEFDDFRNKLLFNIAYAPLARGSFTHVAIVVQDPDTGKLYIYDNYPDPRRDALTGIRKAGTALMDPEEYVYRYGGDLIYYGLRDDPRGQPDIDRVWRYVHEHARDGHEKSFWRRLALIHKLSTPETDSQSRSRFLCTETVIDVLANFGIIPELQTSNARSLMSPMDIARAAQKFGLRSEPIKLTSSK